MRCFLTADLFGPDVLLHALQLLPNSNIAVLAQCCTELAEAAEETAERRVAACGSRHLHRAGEPWLRTLRTLEAKQARRMALAVQTLVLRRRVLGGGHPDCGASLLDIAQLYILAAQYTEAGGVARRARALARAPAERAECMLLQADALKWGGAPAAARALAEQAWELYAVLPGHRADCARALFRAAEAEEALGHPHQALHLLRSAAPVAADTFGEKSELFCSILGLQGRVLVECVAQPRAGLPLLRQSLAISRELYGNADFNVAAAMNALASAFTHLGRHAEGLHLFEQSNAITEEAFGHAHVEVASGKYNTALCLCQLGRHSEALVYAQAALAIECRVLGSAHPHTKASVALQEALLRDA